MLPSVALEARTIGNPVQARKVRESLQQLAKQKQEEADETRQALRFVRRDPYVPPEYDYGLEIGAAWAKMNYYSVGANVGFHLGRCVFSNSQTCQQYFDLIFNVNGRDAHTHYLGLGSLRWQFIKFPSSWSPLVRIMAGGENQIIPGTVDRYFIYGVGAGITTYLHPKADARLEVRFFQADHVYTQVLFNVQFKMEKWVEFFAEKLKDIGVGTAGVVGGVVEGAGDVTGINKKEADRPGQPKGN